MVQGPGERVPPPLLVQVLFRIFEAMNCGCVLLDRTRRVVHSSGRARRCLNDGLILKNERLSAIDRASDALLQAMLDEHLGIRAHLQQRPREALGLNRADKGPIAWRIVPIEEEAQPELDGAAVLLVLVDLEDCPEPSRALLQQVFGMTPSESRVAARLICGDSPQEIAEAFGVGIGTVRTQVKSILSRTQMHRQAELVRLLTRLAMISEGTGDA